MHMARSTVLWVHVATVTVPGKGMEQRSFDLIS